MFAIPAGGRLVGACWPCARAGRGLTASAKRRLASLVQSFVQSAQADIANLRW